MIEPELLGALVWTESRYCAAAKSPEGAIGLGQLMPATAAELGVDPYDLQGNLDGSAKYLRKQYDTFGSWKLALAAYNAGPGAVNRYHGVPPYQETIRYIAEVVRVYHGFVGQTHTDPVPTSLRVYSRRP